MDSELNSGSESGPQKPASTQRALRRSVSKTPAPASRCRAIRHMGRRRPGRRDGVPQAPRRTRCAPAKRRPGSDSLGKVRHRLCAELQRLRPLSINPAPPNTGWIARYAWSGHAVSAEKIASEEPEELLPPTITTSFLAVCVRLNPHCTRASAARLAAMSTPPSGRASYRREGRRRLDRKKYLRH